MTEDRLLFEGYHCLQFIVDLVSAAPPRTITSQREVLVHADGRIAGFDITVAAINGSGIASDENVHSSLEDEIRVLITAMHAGRYSESDLACLEARARDLAALVYEELGMELEEDAVPELLPLPDGAPPRAMMN